MPAARLYLRVMATYKVIQDIEAEDKLIGPLTLRQSIYAGVAAICGYLSFVAITNNLSLLLFIFLPPMIFTAFFAFPWGRDQSTEIWALAKIRYFLKARKRLWDQSGVKELVTITAPKHDVRIRTNGLNQTEVKSRLNALASTLDSRGWAVKNVYTIPPMGQPQPSSDRLLDVTSLPREVSPLAVTDAEDIMDTNNNAQARHIQELVASSASNHKQQLMEHMRAGDMGTLPAPAVPASAPPAADYWFVTNPVSLPQPMAAATTKSDDAVIADLEERQEAADAVTGHMKTIEPLSAIKPAPARAAPAAPGSPSREDSA